MNEVTTYRWSFEEDIRNYVDFGYQAIGVWRQKLSDFGEENGVDLLAESHLKVTGLFWAGGFTGSEGHSFDEALEDGLHAIRLAGALNANCLVMFTGARNNHTFRHAERLLRLALDEMLELAEASDVVLAIEPMHPACAADWTFLTDMETTLDLIQSYQTPHLKLVFDSFHFGHDLSLIANLREIVPHIGLVQLGDRNLEHSIDQERCPLGSGILPLEKLLSELMGAGYTGDFDVELCGSEIEYQCYESLLQGTLKSFEQLIVPASKR